MEFGKPTGSPLAKRSAECRTDAAADGKDGVEVVIIHEPGDLAGALGLNYSEFPNRCRRIEFRVIVNSGQMFIYGRNGNSKQFRDQA